MAWSNHAILLLKNSSYGPAYASRIASLAPKIEKAMDFLMLQTSKNKLHQSDDGSPNRTLINANAYGFGYLLLEGVTSQAKRNAYPAESQVWINNEFVNDKLYRSLDGIYQEHDGYDTSYQGVANWMFLRYLIHFPEATSDGLLKGAVREIGWKSESLRTAWLTVHTTPEAVPIIVPATLKIRTLGQSKYHCYTGLLCLTDQREMLRLQE